VRPLLFVTGHAPAYRVGALARLHELEDIDVALFGGRAKHGGGVFEGVMPFPHRHVRPHELALLAGRGRYRAVVCPTGGRTALLATWAGARASRKPLLLWASLWAHPRTPAHALSYLPLRRLYRSADAVVTYGPHVSAYVRRRGAHNVHVAPQSVDNEFWRSSEPAPPSDMTPPSEVAPPGEVAPLSEPGWPADAALKVLFVGRAAREKGLQVLLEAWDRSGLRPPEAALVLAGVGAESLGSRAADGLAEQAAGVHRLEPVPAVRLRSIYAAADMLVLPSIATRTFLEPWGLVVNEAMDRGLPVIASDAVGAAAGGLVRDGRNGLVVPAGDADALAAAIARLAGDETLRARLAAAAAADVRAYDHDSWARGFSEALASLGLSRGRC
jgi:glycosyltransferase involved in cell wall biosynthesis